METTLEHDLSLVHTSVCEDGDISDGSKYSKDDVSSPHREVGRRSPVVQPPSPPSMIASPAYLPTHYPTHYPAIQLFYLLPGPLGPTLIPVHTPGSTIPRPVFLPTNGLPPFLPPHHRPTFLPPHLPNPTTILPCPPPGFGPQGGLSTDRSSSKERETKFFRPWEDSDHEENSEETISDQRKEFVEKYLKDVNWRMENVSM